MTAFGSLCKGYRWVVGDGQDISATKDQWLRSKRNFTVEDSHFYAGRNDKVVNYIEPGSKIWNVQLVTKNFLPGDVKAILGIPIPQHVVKDRLVWADSSSKTYTAKE